jgi:hypothetical protein
MKNNNPGTDIIIVLFLQPVYHPPARDHPAIRPVSLPATPSAFAGDMYGFPAGAF